MTVPSIRRTARIALAVSIALFQSSPTHAQIKAHVPPNITPAWNKGIQAINAENYWNAVACGKQGGENPGCVFYDTGLCANGDFTLALYTPYKMVAYAVWTAVRKKQPPPTPSYAEAQRTRVILGIKPVRGSKNPITKVAIKRGGRVVQPASQSLDGAGGTFIFDYAAFAPTTGITIELIGRDKTHACVVDRAVLARFR